MKKESLTIIELIENELLKHPEGLWISELARKLKMKESTLHYYLFGKEVNGKFYGGYLKDRIRIKRLARGKLVFVSHIDSKKISNYALKGALKSNQKNEISSQQVEEIKKLENEIKELEEKLKEVSPEEQLNIINRIAELSKRIKELKR